MHAPALVRPALELRRYLDGGGLLTPWAEAACGQTVTADVQTEGPPWLDVPELAQFGMAAAESWAALRRAGRLVQADGTPVARVTSVISVGRAHQVDAGLIRTLTGTSVPLGKALPEARSLVLWCSVVVCEYAVACGRLILAGDVPVAVTTDWVLWSWLDSLEPAGG